jgi:hypothetical protein
MRLHPFDNKLPKIGIKREKPAVGGAKSLMGLGVVLTHLFDVNGDSTAFQWGNRPCSRPEASGLSFGLIVKSERMA